MHLRLLQFLFATSLIPVAAALQSIYLATIGSSAGPGSYIAFFSDSDPCADGTSFGCSACGFDNCDQDLAIVGHPNITFTGCTPYTGTFPGSRPRGVADDGAPALRCKPASNPPGTQYYAVCEPDMGYGTNVGFVNLVYYCS